jgi:glutamate synthase (NADPH/NADH) small chain
MGKITGFKEYTRELPKKLAVEDRIQNYREFYTPFPKEKVKEQAARCMDCGVPFCHTGCPLGNIIPDWNDLVYRGNWREAINRLHATNNFPEFTGRLCPAPCEEACVLGINEPAVTIEQIEKEIIENAFAEGWIVPEPPVVRTGKKVAVIGSGPAGLAAAQQLNRAGHTVTVYEREDRIGGLLRYGIPDFKMEKQVIDRRLAILEAEGITFKTGVTVGKDLPVDQLKQEFDSVVICIGSTKGRDLQAPGRDLKGIHLAMDFLPQQNRRVAGDHLDGLTATGKHVIVIGGGDTGSDCIGTSRRHGAASVTNFELLPMPSKDRPENQPWPYWPMRLRTSTSHEEGCERVFSILTKEFIGSNGKVEQLKTVEVRFAPNPAGGPPKLEEVPGTEKLWKADLVLLAMGFVGPEADSFVSQLGCDLDKMGNLKADANYMTSVPGIFAAGDARRGQSLIVWAISEGREAARCVDLHLMGKSDLPTKAGHDLPRA